MMSEARQQTLAKPLPMTTITETPDQQQAQQTPSRPQPP